VKPFAIAVPQTVLDRIAARLALSAVGYAPADDADWKYGVDAVWLQGLLDYWRNQYDWRAAERELNALPHFIARVEDFDVHFIHVRASAVPARLPIVLTHGWPGSVLEFFEVVGPLAAMGFDVVVPSLPGYGFSSRPAVPIGPRRVAALWRRLMVDELGYSRFGAQGGDWGSAVTTWLGRDHADVVAGIHLNMLFAPPTSAADDEETRAWRVKLARVRSVESAYMLEQSTKPQTIGLALADSPLGFAAWVAEKFHGWGDTHGDIDRRFPKDRLLTNIMLYLVTDTVQSAIWMYRSAVTDKHTASRVTVPTGCALFPAEFMPYPPRSAAERAYNISRWTEMSAGGHFGAMEEPAAFTAEVGAFFASLDAQGGSKITQP
jgi:pimeloyl-ACP methyl ester carboxylesterase